jgi:hypothetical protein
VLKKQLDRLKGEAVARMKAEGIEYDERMAELEKLDYPKPNADFIYATFNDFAKAHPWVGHENIRPKGVARELYDECHDFQTFVQGFGLEKSEGVVLRYFTDVYKALCQVVPERDRTHELEDLIDIFGAVVRGVDSSLLDEWEQLRDPSYRPARTRVEEAAPVSRPGILTDPRAFTVLVRNAAFRLVQCLARRDYEAAAALLDDPTATEVWTTERLHDTFAPYHEDHGRMRTDPKARGTEFCLIDRESDERWSVQQRLVDPDEHNDWVLELAVPIDRSDELDRPVLLLQAVHS